MAEFCDVGKIGGAVLLEIGEPTLATDFAVVIGVRLVKLLGLLFIGDFARFCSHAQILSCKHLDCKHILKTDALG